LTQVRFRLAGALRPAFLFAGNGGPIGRRSLRTEQCACREASRNRGGSEIKWILVKENADSFRVAFDGLTNKSGMTSFFQKTSCCFKLYGEFDPGSGRTLAACLIHASRATKQEGVTLPVESGERVSNTWVTCPGHWDNNGKPLLIPDDPCVPHGMQGKRSGGLGSARGLSACW
jgi:hypothetical protein